MLFGSERSPRRGDLVRVCVRPSVWHFHQKNIEKEFLKHSKESRGVLGQPAKQASRQAGRQAGRQASKQASKQASN